MKKTPRDLNKLAAFIVDQTTNEEPEKEEQPPVIKVLPLYLGEKEETMENKNYRLINKVDAIKEKYLRSTSYAPNSGEDYDVAKIVCSGGDFVERNLSSIQSALRQLNNKE
jgi:hypothetical protein